MAETRAVAAVLGRVESRTDRTVASNNRVETGSAKTIEPQAASSADTPRRARRRGAGRVPARAGCEWCRPAVAIGRRPARGSALRDSRGPTARASASGSLASSASRIARNSAWWAFRVSGATASASTSDPFRSRTHRRAAPALARTATRWATPCSQGPTSSPLRIAPALRTSTKNVAWNASSTSCSSRSTRRQTPRTIGPCRADERGERRLVAAGEEPLQQPIIAVAGRRPPSQDARQITEDVSRDSAHKRRPPHRFERPSNTLNVRPREFSICLSGNSD